MGIGRYERPLEACKLLEGVWTDGGYGRCRDWVLPAERFTARGHGKFEAGQGMTGILGVLLANMEAKTSSKSWFQLARGSDWGSG